MHFIKRYFSLPKDRFRLHKTICALIFALRESFFAFFVGSERDLYLKGEFSIFLKILGSFQ